MKSTRHFCSTILMSCAALCCVNVLASEAEVQQRIVNYADLNLNNTAGAEALYRRIRGAARSVCGRSRMMEPARQHDRRQCTQDAIDNAIADVNNVNLTAYHLERSGRRVEQKMAGRR